MSGGVAVILNGRLAGCHKLRGYWLVASLVVHKRRDNT